MMYAFTVRALAPLPFCLHSTEEMYRLLHGGCALSLAEYMCTVLPNIIEEP